MKKVLSLVVLIGILPVSAGASPGRLDKNGCHKCTSGCAKYGLKDGEFHCHTKAINR